jgi:chorismate mutase
MTEAWIFGYFLAMEISDWRVKIDTIDSQVIALLSERATYAVEIGKIKRQQGLPIFDSNREDEVLNALARLNLGPLPDTSIRRIFQTIMEETRATEASHAED